MEGVAQPKVFCVLSGSLWYRSMHKAKTLHREKKNQNLTDMTGMISQKVFSLLLLEI
jgi:hypothetical protein